MFQSVGENRNITNRVGDEKQQNGCRQKCVIHHDEPDWKFISSGKYDIGFFMYKQASFGVGD
jgi:hypothetical protein